MDSFSATINVNDCCSNNCNSTKRETTKIISNTSQFISLQNCYYIKLLGVTSSYVLIEITNGIIHYIRRAYLNIPINLCLSENCPIHSVTITLTDIFIV